MHTNFQENGNVGFLIYCTMQISKVHRFANSVWTHTVVFTTSITTHEQQLGNVRTSTWWTLTVTYNRLQPVLTH